MWTFNSFIFKIQNGQISAEESFSKNTTSSVFTTDFVTYTFFFQYFSVIALKDTERRDSIPEEDAEHHHVGQSQRQMKPIYEIDKQANNEGEPSTTSATIKTSEESTVSAVAETTTTAAASAAVTVEEEQKKS